MLDHPRQGAQPAREQVVDPAAILAASVRGPSDLYVALTRATARLGVVRAAT